MISAFLQRVRAAFAAGDVGSAEAMLRQRLAADGSDRDVRIELARLLRARGAFSEALDELDRASEGLAVSAVPLLRAALLTRLGRHEEAIAAQRQAIAEEEHPRALLGLAHLLKTAGENDEAAQHSRRALDLDPALGEAWWTLSSLKTHDFSAADRAAMDSLASSEGTDADSRIYVHYALAQALDKAGDAPSSWKHLSEANRLKAEQVRHDPDDITALVDATIAATGAAFFSEREAWGDPTRGPIFVLGMPRSGSTLLEQMLASHSAIEGTSELPHLPALVRQLSGGHGLVSLDYLERVRRMNAAQVAELGRSYLRAAQHQRRTARPHFVDKMPNNWLFAGLIGVILPKAKIIDIRRNPLDCGLSNFRELFARGQTYSYDLGHIGQYYRNYLRLMRHFDEVRPGLVHRVIYEQLVDDPETILGGVFDYLGIDFEAAVLDFHRTKRGVRTASAGQVRQPLNRKGMGQWERYAEWLEPLRSSLGPALDDWARY